MGDAMPYKRSAAMAKPEPTGMALRGNARRSGPWHGGPRGLPRALAQRFVGAGAGAYQAQQQASGQMYRTELQPAQTLASVDRFWLLALGGAVMVAVSLRLKRYDPRTGGQVGVQ